MAANTERAPAAGRGGSRAKTGSERTLTLRLVRSGICAARDQKATLRGLGFRRLGQEITREDAPAIRGMIRKVAHLVEVVKD